MTEVVMEKNKKNRYAAVEVIKEGVAWSTFWSDKD